MLGGQEAIAMFRDSFTLIILSFCSLLSITFMIERWLALRKAGGSGDPILTHIQKLLDGGKHQEAVNYSQKHPSAASQVIHYGLLHSSRPRRLAFADDIQ